MSTVTTDAGRVPALEAEIARLRDEHAAALALVADVRMAFLAPRVAAELGISVAEAEAQIREVCDAVGWAITNDVGHA